MNVLRHVNCLSTLMRLYVLALSTLLMTAGLFSNQRLSIAEPSEDSASETEFVSEQIAQSSENAIDEWGSADIGSSSFRSGHYVGGRGDEHILAVKNSRVCVLHLSRNGGSVLGLVHALPVDSYTYGFIPIDDNSYRREWRVMSYVMERSDRDMTSFIDRTSEIQRCLRETGAFTAHTQSQ